MAGAALALSGLAAQQQQPAQAPPQQQQQPQQPTEISTTISSDQRWALVMATSL